MIVKYPNFSKLDISHKQEIKALVSQFPPYSDFNFISLFCWDIDGTTEISNLNGNLVIKMDDYVTGKPFYSILGKQDIDKSLTTLLNLSPSLKLVPADVINSIQFPSNFEVAEDRDQFDYIYPVEAQVDLAGGHNKIKRNKISKFVRTYHEDLSLKKIQFNDPTTKHEVDQILLSWSSERHRSNDEVRREAAAIEKLFKYAEHFMLVGIKVFLANTFVGFSVNEIVQMDCAICHFQKSILTFENIDVFLSNLAAKELKHFGCKYTNWEQDLGLPGLRRLKESYIDEDSFFLKKYTITNKLAG